MTESSTNIMTTVFGSHLYGLATANSDRDYKGIFMPSVRDILLGRIPKTQRLSSGPSHVRNSQGDVDSETHSLHHFVQLALQGQTVALDMLHGGQEEYQGDIWPFLKANRSRFYTKNMKAFIGYARKQAAKYGIKGSRLDAVFEALSFLISSGEKLTIGDLWQRNRLWETEHCHIHVVANREDREWDFQRSYWDVCGKKMTFGTKATHYVPMLTKFYNNYGKRATLAANNEGIDWKAVSHALRVGYQTKAIFTQQTFSYPLPETPYLLAVKQGQLPFKDVSSELDSLMEELEGLSERSTLPKHPDTTFWEDWLEGVTLDHIKREQTYNPMLGW